MLRLNLASLRANKLRVGSHVDLYKMSDQSNCSINTKHLLYLQNMFKTCLFFVSKDKESLLKLSILFIFKLNVAVLLLQHSNKKLIW